LPRCEPTAFRYSSRRAGGEQLKKGGSWLSSLSTNEKYLIILIKGEQGSLDLHLFGGLKAFIFEGIY
jgi:hypothetical protein